MSSHTYTDSRRYYTEAPKIIQSRGSSSDSRSSYDSKRSTDATAYYSSTKSSMGYYGGSQSKVSEPKVHKYRAPDAGIYISTAYSHRSTTNTLYSADNKYVEGVRRGKVEVINQRKPTYDPDAPLSSDATSSHYKETHHRHSHKHSHRHSSQR